MLEALTLLEDTNPYGNLSAAVEDDGRTVYLYLWRSEAKEEGARAVWVANRLPAPSQDDRSSMSFGVAPLMPKRGTRHPDGHAPFDPGQLSLVWFEEGNGVALLQNGRPLAVLPPWYGRRGCTGYSAEAIGEESLAWELEPGILGTLEPRIHQSQQYWMWRAEPASWPVVQLDGMRHLERELGPHRRYWTGGRGYPRVGVALFQPERYPGSVVYSTVGMSAHRMPQVELCHPDARPHRRVELLLGSCKELPWAPQLLEDLGHYPWASYTWLGNGHTITLSEQDNASDDAGPDAVFLLKDPPVSLARDSRTSLFAPQPNLTGMCDRSLDPVNYLWVLPISLYERDLARDRGCAALLQRLARDARSWRLDDLVRPLRGSEISRRVYQA